MKIIIGLGNIGEKYTNTRHNCGFMVIDQLIKTINKEQGTNITTEENSKLKSLVAKFDYIDQKILLIKPTTLMNLSGQAVIKILNFYKESTENLIVAYDDIDLPLGSIRIREKGSAGTHNGMKSIIESLGTEEFSRIRIGIESRGELTPEQQDLHSFVLSDFTEKEKQIVEKSFMQAVEELKKLISA